jgi:exopolysaccharide biosynthesis polyprenyl glycosylphosphotransferase
MAAPLVPHQTRILLVGSRRDARRLHREVEQATGRSVRILGFVDSRHRALPGPRLRGRRVAVDAQTQPIPVLGGLDRLEHAIDRTRATDLVVAASGGKRRRLAPRLTRLSRPGVRVHWISLEGGRGRPDSRPGARVDVGAPRDHAGGPHLLERIALRAREFDGPRLAKRALDVLGASLGLLLLSPVLLAVALAIYLTSGRPIFYNQERIGQGGRRFRILKFRSMRTDAERETGPIWASDHDSRCTRIGDWLRHSNVDEFPQLFNVLFGQMSLVGPRPERPVFVEQFSGSLPDYDLRHAVPCGMTGWAQVHGWRGRTSLRKRIQYDLDYIERWSFWLDVRILFMTFQHVVWGKTSWNESRPKRPAP